MEQKQEEKITRLREKANQLPMKSGVYLMRDKKNEIVYVGKAKRLKNRVVSYFRAVENHTPKVYQMVMHAEDFDTIVTSSEYEALVLECSLIKQHNPKYNILLKDAKGYTYIRISQEEYPRITVVKGTSEPGEYIGPYMSYYQVRQAVDFANKLFRLPVCNKSFPRDFGRERPCLNAHIDQCMGFCTGRVPDPEFRLNLTRAIKFLKGGSAELSAELEKEMQQAAEKLEFEKAAALRDKIKGLEAVKQKQLILFQTAKEQDAVALVRGENAVCFSVLKIRDGRLVDKNDFISEIEGENPALLAEFLKNYYYQNEDIPPRVYLSEPCEDTELIAQMLHEVTGRNTSFYIPDKGENLKIVQMAEQNARETLSLKTDRSNKHFDALVLLQKLLGLEVTPKYIESYDISNMGEGSIVAGMVVFEDAMPKKGAYKRFELKEMTGQDDYGAMAQVLTRRFGRYFACQEKGSKDGGFERLPDLILLDGGLGHVRVVGQVLAELGVEVPVFGMVKNTRHKTKAIADSGGEIEIASNKTVFTLVAKIQEEVHRYSVAYLHHKLKQKTIATELTQIPGIGRVKAQKLLKTCKSVEKVREMTIEALCAVDGISRADAGQIFNFYHPAEDAPES